VYLTGGIKAVKFPPALAVFNCYAAPRAVPMFPLKILFYAAFSGRRR
jgi:hypothetical protein